MYFHWVAAAMAMAARIENRTVNYWNSNFVLRKMDSLNALLYVDIYIFIYVCVANGKWCCIIQCAATDSSAQNQSQFAANCSDSFRMPHRILSLLLLLLIRPSDIRCSVQFKPFDIIRYSTTFPFCAQRQIMWTTLIKHRQLTKLKQRTKTKSFNEKRKKKKEKQSDSVTRESMWIFMCCFVVFYLLFPSFLFCSFCFSLVQRIDLATRYFHYSHSNTVGRKMYLLAFPGIGGRIRHQCRRAVFTLTVIYFKSCCLSLWCLHLLTSQWFGPNGETSATDKSYEHEPQHTYTHSSNSRAQVSSDWKKLNFICRGASTFRHQQKNQRSSIRFSSVLAIWTRFVPHTFDRTMNLFHQRVPTVCVCCHQSFALYSAYIKFVYAFVLNDFSFWFTASSIRK